MSVLPVFLSLWYIGGAVDSFQQEGGVSLDFTLFHYFHHGRCNNTYHL